MAILMNGLDRYGLADRSCGCNRPGSLGGWQIMD
jgi:hypothetical protein